MRMWETARGQPQTLNWIPIAPGIQFSTRPATWNEQNSNSFHLSEFGDRAGNVPRLSHFAARGVGNSERVRFYFTHYTGR